MFYDIRPETLADAPKDALGIPQPPVLQLADENGDVVTDDEGNPMPGLFLTENFPPGTEGDPSCTAHVMEQWGSENRIFLAWYHAGGHVFDFQIDTTQQPPTIRFTEPGYESLVGGPGPQWSWTTLAYRAVANEDGTTTYWVVNADLQRGVDFMKVTLEAPPSNIEPPAPSPTPSENVAPDDTTGSTPMPSTGGGLALGAFAVLAAAGVSRSRRAARRRDEQHD